MFGKKTKQPALIFIAEDNAMYAKTLQLFLKSKFTSAVIEVFPVGEILIDNLPRNPDVVILDYFLNSRYHDASNGLEMTKEIRAKNRQVNIILLSGQQDIQVAVQAMKEAGASYIMKDEQAFANVEETINKAFAGS